MVKQDGADIEMQAVDKEKELRKELERRFKEIDTDGSGTIDKGEVTAEMENKFGGSVTPAELDQLWAKFDSNKNGVLEMEEFVQMGQAIADGSLDGRLGDKMRTLMNISILQKHKKKIFGMSLATIGAIVAVVVIGAAAGGAAAASGGGGGGDDSVSAGNTRKAPTTAEERAALQAEISAALSVQRAEAMPSTTSSTGGGGSTKRSSQKSSACASYPDSCKCQAEQSASFCSGCLSTGSGCNGCSEYCAGEKKKSELPVDAPVLSADTYIEVQDPTLGAAQFVSLVGCYMEASGIKEYAVNKTMEHYANLGTSTFGGTGFFLSEFDSKHCEGSSTVRMNTWHIKISVPLSTNSLTDYKAVISWPDGPDGDVFRLTVTSEVAHSGTGADAVTYLTKQRVTWLGAGQTGFVETKFSAPNTPPDEAALWEYSEDDGGGTFSQPFGFIAQYRFQGSSTDGLAVSRMTPGMYGSPTDEQEQMLIECAINNNIYNTAACDDHHNGAFITTYWLKYNPTEALRVVDQNMSDTHCLNRHDKATLYRDYSLYNANDGKLLTLVTDGRVTGPSGGVAWMSNHGLYCENPDDSNDCTDLVDDATVTYETHTAQGEQDITGTLNFGDKGRLKRVIPNQVLLADIAGTELLTESSNPYYIMYNASTGGLVQSRGTESFCVFVANVQCSNGGHLGYSHDDMRDGPVLTSVDSDFANNQNSCAGLVGDTVQNDGCMNVLSSTGEYIEIRTRPVHLPSPIDFIVDASHLDYCDGSYKCLRVRSAHNYNLNMEINIEYNENAGVTQQPDGATAVEFELESYMTPSTLDAPTTLYCHGYACPKGGGANDNANDPSSWTHPPASYNYTFNAATSTLTDLTEGAAVEMCNFVDCSSSEESHYGYGPFLVEQVTSEYFVWYPQPLYSVTDASSGTVHTLDDEPVVLYKHDSSAGPGSSGISYDGSYFALQYRGSGNLHGLPSVEVDSASADVSPCYDTCSWPYYSDINIPDRSYMTNMADGTPYFSVAANAAEYLRPTTSSSTCDPMRATVESESQALPLPTAADWVAPENAGWYGVCTDCDVMLNRQLQLSSGTPTWTETVDVVTPPHV